MPVFRILFCQEQLIRDLYEGWLIMFVGMFVRWNRLLQLDVPLQFQDAHHRVRESTDYRLADVFFGGGLLAFILPFRCYWVRRCQHRIQLLFLAVEVMLLLRIVEFNDNIVWQPFLGIYRDMFETLGCSDFRIYCYIPGMAEWLADGRAYESFQLLVSFAFFVAGINSVAEEWIKTVDLLLLGREPQHPCQAWRRHYREFHRQGKGEATTSNSLTNPTPDYLMYRRLCTACIHEANAQLCLVPTKQEASIKPEIKPESIIMPSSTCEESSRKL